MSRNLSVNVEFLTRVEGHGHIVVDVAQGNLRKCELQIVEAPRFFEIILQGHSIYEAQHLTSRICGICSCGHSLASIQAAEAALGVTPDGQTETLRTLLLQMEFLDSHLLHIYLLAAPDLLGARSFIDLLGSHGDTVRRALRMKKACNEICELLAGRHVHPLAMVIGGFTRIPSVEDVNIIHGKLLSLRADLEATVELLAGLTFPEFERETEYVALVNKTNEYPLRHGCIGSTDGVRKPVQEYRTVTNEYSVPHSSAKHTRLSRGSYAVGALARFNLNYGGLHQRAKKVAAEFGLQPTCCNPYLNTAAQLVECVHCCEDALATVESLLTNGVDRQAVVVVGNSRALPDKAGSGVGAVEVPRGLLFHHYEVDERGIITQANCVIPTGQNLGNIEEDMRRLVPSLLKKSDAEITLALEMLVRAYDPCISCSTHVLEVSVVGRGISPADA